jgi:hypothetical protein
MASPALLPGVSMRCLTGCPALGASLSSHNAASTGPEHANTVGTRRICDVTAKKSPPNEPMGRILHFRPRQTASQTAPRRPAAQDSGHGSPVETLEKFEHAGEEDDYRHRMVVNIAAFIVAVLLILAGVWLAMTMAEMRKNQDCVLSGRRGCTPVDAAPGERF